LSRRPSLTFRLTALFALTSVVVLAGLGVFIVAAIERHFNEQDDQLLRNELQLVHAIVHEKGVDAIADTFGASLHDHPGFFVDIRTAGDSPAAYSTLGDSSALLLSAAATHAPGTPFMAGEPGAHRAFRAIKAMIPSSGASAPLQVLVAVDTSVHEHFFHDFRNTLMLYTAAAALLTIVLGWWVARQGLSPLRAMAASARAVTSQNFDVRMPVDDMPAEMANLARPLNAMLERLQGDFARLTEFSSDLAHELRTPISNLLIQSQVVLTQDRTAPAYREVLESYAEELQRLARTISDMLFLAQTENGITLPTVEDLDVAAEVQGLFEFYEALAEEKQVRLQCSGAGGIRGDRLMLRRALSNLLSNALRYTPAGGAVIVRIQPSAGHVQISVDNDGQDIPPDVLPHLFDRFFRGDKSRAQLESGSAGLGLAITRAIVQAHGGTVAVTSQGGKTSFILVFPA
jgi:two-component system heavy metal sensor histidine kinase CusS